jgi:hypothetical protein
VEPKVILVCFFLASATTGCVSRLPPPPTPASVEPAIADPPTTPPAEGHGRVVLDTVGESASVSRVTATQVQPIRGLEGNIPADHFAAKTHELLCITPCVVDIRQGAHTFVFTSKVNPGRSSEAEIPVTSRVMYVRHAMGTKPQHASSYANGWGLILGGVTITSVGLLTTTLGLLAEPRPGPDGRADGTPPKTIVTLGLVMLGIGLVTGTAGVVMAHDSAPVEQAGSTATWLK